MDKRKKWLTVFFTLVLFICLGMLGESKSISQEEGEITSSQSCKECHEEIYSHWKNAMHSMSIEDPIFMASYLESYFNTGGQAKTNCLQCHAPVALVNDDYDLKKEVTKEGVSCDFCHSIKSVDLEKKGNPFEITPGNTKWGPLSELSSPAHETQPSDIFRSSRLCAGCHEYTNDNGVTVLGTFSEWEKSKYPAENIQCQNCHMPLMEGDIVSPKIKSSKHKKINLHAISAAHSKEQLEKAVKVEIKDLKKEENFITVIVDVENIGSGHMVPTGIPARKLILWVELRAPNEYFSQQRVYQRILLDREGNSLKKVYDVFFNSASVSLDNRLRPGEVRTESFVFAMPQNKNFQVTARIEYLYIADVMTPTEMRVKMAEAIRKVSK
jgi:hypothetical protein